MRSINLFSENRVLPVFVLSLFLVFSLVSCQRSKVILGAEAPPFTLKDLHGRTVQLSDFKGKIVLLNFWAFWCFPCRLEIPHINHIWEEYHKKGVEIVTVNMDMMDPGSLQEEVEKEGIQYRVLLGTNKVMKEYGGIEGLPLSYLIDQEGRITKRYLGYRPGEIFIRDIEELLHP